MVISRSVDKYATEFSEENKKFLHVEEASSSTRKRVAMEQREQLVPSSSSSPTLPKNIDKYDTHLATLDGLREDDGAIDWEKAVTYGSS